jgi:hypothetical protein
MHSVHDEHHFLRVSINGTVDLKELYDTQKDLMLHPAYPHKNSLWVFGDSFTCDFSINEMFNMIDRIKLFFPIGGTKEKSAFLVSSNLHLAFFKLFSEEAENRKIPFKIRSFMNYAEAEAWLKGESEFQLRF